MSNARAHEDWAARLLAEFLTAGGQIVKKWERGADPPEFVFFVNDEQWAVEVTRADQRVRSADGGRSRTDADTKLSAFGKAIAAKYRQRLRRPYMLTLRPMPGVTDTKAWKDKARRAINAVIENNSKGPFVIDFRGRAAPKGLEIGDVVSCAELRGYEVGEGGAENRIWVIVDAGRVSTPEGHAPYDILANLEEAIRYALTDKSKKLGKMAGFDRTVLVLDNRYWLAEITDAKPVAQSIAPSFPVFDAVYMTHAGAMYEIYRREARPDRRLFTSSRD